MTISNLHDRLAAIIILVIFALAIWGLWRAYRKQGLDGAYWGALTILQVLILLQAALGISLWISTQRPQSGNIHLLYAGLTTLTLPVVYAYTHARDSRHEMLVYGLAALALVALAGRSIATGGG